MAKTFQHTADIGGQFVPYSALPRADRGKWMLVYPDPSGKRVKAVTTHDIRGKHPPTEFHQQAAEIIRKTYRPPTLFPDPKPHKSWDDCLAEVEQTGPTIRPETIRSFRAAIKAWLEVMPDTTSPLDVSEEKTRRFAKLWLAAPNKQHPGKPRSPVTLSYYLRALSAFTNHLIQLGYFHRNVWHGVKAPKAERKEPRVPTEDEVSKFFAYVRDRYPTWTALHALLELKAVSACRTADVCQIKADQLRDGRLTFAAGTVKTKRARSLPLPPDLFATLKAVAGETHLWERLFAEIKDYRKASNGYPPSFSWRTVYAVINNIFREYNEGPNAGNPRFTPHALRRRAITLTVAAVGMDAAAVAIGVHPQTARTHYLDAERAFQTDDVMGKVAEALRPKGERE